MLFRSDFLNSPHNTWNYPSPNTSPATHPRRSPTPSIPFSPIPIAAPSFIFPNPSVSPPNFLNVLAELAEQELRAPDVEVKLEPVGTHYCLAVGNNEGLELDETDEDEELGKSDEEEIEEDEGKDVRGIQCGGGRQENSLRDYSLNSRGLIYKYRVVCA